MDPNSVEDTINGESQYCEFGEEIDLFAFCTRVCHITIRISDSRTMCFLSHK